MKQFCFLSRAKLLHMHYPESRDNLDFDLKRSAPLYGVKRGMAISLNHRFVIYFRLNWSDAVLALRSLDAVP